MVVQSMYSYIREHQSNAYNPRYKETLEEDIRAMRIQMEQLVHLENSFTSEVVLELSMLLDEKINEYNDLILKQKKQS